MAGSAAAERGRPAVARHLLTLRQDDEAIGASVNSPDPAAITAPVIAPNPNAAILQVHTSGDEGALLRLTADLR